MIEKHERWLVLGKTHTGKSTWAKAEVAVLVREGARVIALDVTDEWSALGRPRDDVDPGPMRTRMTAAELTKKPAAILAPKLALSVVPNEQTSASAARAFELICRLQRHSPHVVVLVLDEAHTWAKHVDEMYCDLATTGRHWGGGIAVISVSQRANRVPLTVRSQSSRIVSFLQDEPDDVEGLAKKTGRGFAEAAARLPPHSYLEWRDSAAPAAQTQTQATQLEH